MQLKIPCGFAAGNLNVRNLFARQPCGKTSGNTLAIHLTTKGGE
jgi:hypothetical protein